MISIIIPYHNSHITLPTCLKSCFQQTHTSLEIIIIDNNSTDHSTEVIKSLIPQSPFPIHLHQNPQSGVNATRNIGFLQSQGDYIQWLDADDQLHPNKLAFQVAALEANPDVDIAYSGWHWCFYKNQTLQTQLSFTSQPHSHSLLSLLLDNWRPPHSYLLRRSTASQLHKLQAWNPQTEIATDREYFTLAALLGFRFLYVPGASVYYNRWSTTQITQSTPYAKRVQTLDQMFQRFQNSAHRLPSTSFHQDHQFLLQQNWNLWKSTIIRVTPHNDYESWIHHPHSPNRTLVNSTEAAIATALLQSPQARTLEDHARWVVRQLWKMTLMQQGNLHAPFQTIDHRAIAHHLNQMLEVSEKYQHLNQTLHIPHLSSSKTADWFESIPLYAPLFGAQRFAIHQILENFRQRGWLEQVTL
jgi:glycosyltransferase involved in cell wall biosynthesis